MNLTPHEKTKTLIIVYGGTLVTGIIAFLLWNLLSPFIMGGGSVIALCGFGIAFIIQGIRRLREAHSHGQIISWYQQPSLVLGLITCSCILAVGIIFICSTVIHIHSRLLSHLTTIFCILTVFPVFFYINILREPILPSKSRQIKIHRGIQDRQLMISTACFSGKASFGGLARSFQQKDFNHAH